MMPKKEGLNPLGPRYLRVRTPRTSDGKTLVYDQNSQPIFDESHSPLSALKHLERINVKLPKMYKMLIEEVDETREPDFANIVKGVGKTTQEQKNAPAQMPDLKINEDKLQAEQLKNENEALKKQLADLKKQQTAKAGPGKPVTKPATAKAPAKDAAAAELV